MKKITKDNLIFNIRKSMLLIISKLNENNELSILDEITTKRIVAGTIMLYNKEDEYFDENDRKIIIDSFNEMFPKKEHENKVVVKKLINYIKNHISDTKEIINMLDIEENVENITRIICLAFAIDMLIFENYYVSFNLKNDKEIKEFIKDL